MRIAVIADVHANLPALEAALTTISALAPDAILCLGDTVGYNAEPAACLDLIAECRATVVAGNHDLDVATGRHPQGTNEAARVAQEWTRDRLDTPRLEALARLPTTVVEQGVYVALHGSFLGADSTLGYVTSTMLDENLAAIRARGDALVGFCGHSHVPLMGWLVRGVCTEVGAGDATEVTWPADAEAVLFNPGAIGQPRDHDPRASFAVVDFERRTARWHRIAYDIERAASAILRAGLPASLAERLKEGR